MVDFDQPAFRQSLFQLYPIVRCIRSAAIRIWIPRLIPSSVVRPRRRRDGLARNYGYKPLNPHERRSSPTIGIPGNFPSFKSFTALVFNTELGALFVKSGPVGFLPIRSKAAFSSSTIELPLVFLWNQPLLQASYPRHFPTRHYRWCSRVRR